MRREKYSCFHLNTAQGFKHVFVAVRCPLGDSLHTTLPTSVGLGPKDFGHGHARPDLAVDMSFFKKNHIPLNTVQDVQAIRQILDSMQCRLDDSEALMQGYAEKLHMVNGKVDKVLEHLEAWEHSAYQQPDSTLQHADETCSKTSPYGTSGSPVWWGRNMPSTGPPPEQAQNSGPQQVSLMQALTRWRPDTRPSGSHAGDARFCISFDFMKASQGGHK